MKDERTYRYRRGANGQLESCVFECDEAVPENEGWKDTPAKLEGWDEKKLELGPEPESEESTPSPPPPPAQKDVAPPPKETVKEAPRTKGKNS